MITLLPKKFHFYLANVAAFVIACVFISGAIFLVNNGNTVSSGSCSDFNNNQATCESNEGCTYPGTLGDCTDFNNAQMSCVDAGCTYPGDAGSCSDFNNTQSSCENAGCVYPGNTGDCSSFNGDINNCSNTTGCSYDGSEEDCSVFNSDQSACEAAAGCTADVGNDCSGFIDEPSCIEFAGCGWDGSSCSGYYFSSCMGMYTSGSGICSGSYDTGECQGNYDDGTCSGSYDNGICEGEYDEGDISPPTITNITSDKADGTYSIGEIININFTFSESVTSSGDITVTLETGDIDRTCTFSVSNADSGSCQYTVQTGDVSADLDVTLVSGSIDDQASNAMVSFTPAVSLASNKNIIIDGILPFIEDISSNVSNGTYPAGEVIDLVVVFNKVVTSSGNITLTLETGDVDQTCTFFVSANTVGNCNYTVQPGDISADLDISLVSVSGDIHDQFDNAMIDFTPVVNLAYNKDIIIDAVPPTITNISSSKADGPYTAGEVIDIDITFSENVTSSGDVTVTLETGNTDRSCTFTLTNEQTGTCDYTVQEEDTSPDLTVSSISGTIHDQVINPMTNFIPLTNLSENKAFVIDTTSPTVSVTSPTEGATVSGASVALVASASDTNLVGVQFKRDTHTLIGVEDTSSPYGVTWDVSGLSNGPQSLIAVARDIAGNYATSTTISVTVNNDSSAPSISAGSPSTEQVAGTTEVTLSVTTNENATCKYGTTAGTAYASIASTFTSTGGTTHTATITGLTNGTSHTYYVRCTDGSSNANTSDYEIAFSVADEAPVSSGTISGGSYGPRTINNPNPIDSVKQKLIQTLTLLIERLIEEIRLKQGLPNNNQDNQIIPSDLNFNTNLSVPMNHPDVLRLQRFLNTNGFPVALIGPGSLNNETTLFGVATYSALVKFQQANNISPASGYFGPLTREYVNNRQ